MGNKVMRYPAAYPDVLVSGENGGWLLVRGVLDKPLFDLISNNLSVTCVVLPSSPSFLACVRAGGPRRPVGGAAAAAPPGALFHRPLCCAATS